MKSKKILPEENSQEWKVLNHLKNRGAISNVKAVLNYRICRLSAVILRLRQKGWKIRTIDRRKQYEPGYFGEYKLSR